MRKSRRLARVREKQREALGIGLVLQHREHLIALAAEAQLLVARQHRKFHVGGAALALDCRGNAQIFSAGNYMPKPVGEGPRHCAEEFLKNKAKKAQCVEIAAMVIYADPQVDDYTGIDKGVLISCGKSCRPMFERDMDDPAEVIKRHTVLIFVNAQNPQVTWQTTVEDLLAECRKHVHVTGAHPH